VRLIAPPWSLFCTASIAPDHYAGMGIYKILIMVFNLVPLLVLWIFGKRQARVE